MGVLSRIFRRTKMIQGYQFIERQSRIHEPNIVGTRITVPQLIRDLEWGKRVDLADEVIRVYNGKITRPILEEVLRYYSANKKEIDDFIDESIKRSGTILSSDE